MPWKNGGGVTHEIAACPEGAGFDDIVWRLSMAEVASDGPFSPFRGIDRTLTLLEGAGIALDFQGGSILLNPGAAPLTFPGEAAVSGRLVDGPILDLNVMTRRGASSHQVIELGPGALTPPGTVALVARERAGIGEAVLDAGDSILSPDPDGVVVTAGRLLAVIVRIA